MMNRKNALAVAFLFVAGLSACGGTNPADVTGDAQSVTVDVQPTQAQTQPSGTVAFLGAVAGTVDTTVIWEVVDAGGGTIDTSGRYTAPSSIGQYRVRAVSKADPTVQAVATVSVVLSPTVGVSISPSSTSIASGGSVTFAASVTGTSDTSVSWIVQETSGCGAISSTGVYTAPGTNATCHVVATSRADATKSAAATVTVTAATPPPSPFGSAPRLRYGTAAGDGNGLLLLRLRHRCGRGLHGGQRRERGNGPVRSAPDVRQCALSIQRDERGRHRRTLPHRGVERERWRHLQPPLHGREHLRLPRLRPVLGEFGIGAASAEHDQRARVHDGDARS